MSTTPHFWPTLTGKIAPEAELAVKMAFNALQEHEQGLNALNTKILALQAQATAATASTTTTTAVTTTTTVPVGAVNNQTGTSYTVQNSDSGGIITFANAAAVAVTLNTAVEQYWFAALENLGPGLVTVTPSSGTINGAATLTLTTSLSAWIFFDGTNWWAATAINPVATTSSVGTVQPDGTTILISSGVISAVGGTSSNTHSESLTDGFSNFIFAIGDIVTVVGVPN